MQLCPQVLAFGAPTWSLIDAADPASGGVRAIYYGETPSEGDPYCGFNPITGAPFGRVLHFDFLCDPDQPGAVLTKAVVNSTNVCDITLLFSTSVACWSEPPGSDDGPDVAEVFTVVGALAALAAGVLIVVCIRRKRWLDNPESEPLYVPKEAGAPDSGDHRPHDETAQKRRGTVGWDGSAWVMVEEE